MPASTKQQWKFMKAVASGKAKNTHGLTPAQAREYISSQPTPKGLPKRAKKGKRK